MWRSPHVCSTVAVSVVCLVRATCLPLPYATARQAREARESFLRDRQSAWMYAVQYSIKGTVHLQRLSVCRSGEEHVSLTAHARGTTSNEHTCAMNSSGVPTLFYRTNPSGRISSQPKPATRRSATSLRDLVAPKQSSYVETPAIDLETSAHLHVSTCVRLLVYASVPASGLGP